MLRILNHPQLLFVFGTSEMQFYKAQVRAVKAIGVSEGTGRDVVVGMELQYAFSARVATFLWSKSF
jgi:hypothetical protein